MLSQAMHPPLLVLLKLNHICSGHRATCVAWVVSCAQVGSGDGVRSPLWLSVVHSLLFAVATLATNFVRRAQRHRTSSHFILSPKKCMWGLDHCCHFKQRCGTSAALIVVNKSCATKTNKDTQELKFLPPLRNCRPQFQ